MTLTFLLLFIVPSTVASLLTSALPTPLLPSASGRCFKASFLITFQFFLLSRFLYSPSPPNVLLSIFGKLFGITLLSTSIYTVLLQRNAVLFPLQLHSLPLRHRLWPNLSFFLTASDINLKPSGGLLKR